MNISAEKDILPRLIFPLAAGFILPHLLSPEFAATAVQTGIGATVLQEIVLVSRGVLKAFAEIGRN